MINVQSVSPRTENYRCMGRIYGKDPAVKIKSYQPQIWTFQSKELSCKEIKDRANGSINVAPKLSSSSCRSWIWHEILGRTFRSSAMRNKYYFWTLYEERNLRTESEKSKHNRKISKSWWRNEFRWQFNLPTDLTRESLEYEETTTSWQEVWRHLKSINPEGQ